MRKIILSAALIMGGMLLHAQQVDFGVTAGFLNGEAKVKGDGITISGSESGFYIGAVADFTLNEDWHIQPELFYASIDESDALFLPIMAKYYVAPKFNLQAGPQFVFSLEESVEDISNVGIDLAGGVGFDITESFFAEARYSFQLNNAYTGPEDVTLRANYLTIGLGYTF